MENTENNLSGGLPGPEEEREKVALVEQITESLKQETAGPTSPSTPTKIEREDLLEYKLLGSRAANAELQVTMYERELQRSKADMNVVAHEGRKFLETLSEKYKVDFVTHIITEDGYLVPRPIDQLASVMRK